MFSILYFFLIKTTFIYTQNRVYWVVVFHSFLLCFSLQWSLALSVHCTTLKSLCTALGLFYTHMQGTMNWSGCSLMKKGFASLLKPPYRHTLVAGAQSGQDRVFQMTLLPIANTFKPLLPTSSTYFENEGLPSKWFVFPLCQMGCSSFWEVLFVLASGLSILVDAYIILRLWQWFAILSVRVRGWSLLLGRPSLWLSSLSLRVGYLFMSADCLPLWVGCLSLSMVVYPYEWVVCPTEWVVHICEWDVHPFLFWAGCPCLWVHYCAPYCAWVACSCEWVVCPREWVVCPCEWVVCSCELVLSS